MSAELLKMKEDQTNSVERKRYQDQITSLLEEQNTLRERNRILKETIRDDSEAYSTHPVKNKRIKAVKDGYSRGNESKKTITNNSNKIN